MPKLGKNFFYISIVFNELKIRKIIINVDYEYIKYEVYIQVFILHCLLESLLEGELSGAHGFNSGDQGNQAFF